MRFLDHGRMFYSLDIVEPSDVARSMALAASVPKRIFEGRYTISRREVTVEVMSRVCGWCGLNICVGCVNFYGW